MMGDAEGRNGTVVADSKTRTKLSIRRLRANQQLFKSRKRDRLN